MSRVLGCINVARGPMSQGVIELPDTTRRNASVCRVHLKELAIDKEGLHYAVCSTWCTLDYVWIVESKEH